MSQVGNVIQGTLDLLILKAVSVKPLHGWGIIARWCASAGAMNLVIDAR